MTKRTLPAISLSLAALVSAFLAPLPAGAVSWSVRSACMSDYFAHCSQHAVGSQALRTCMKTNGSKLKPRCVDALVSAGEISRGYIAKRRSASAN